MGSSGEQSNSGQHYHPRVSLLPNDLTGFFFVPHLLPLVRGANSMEIRQGYAALMRMLSMYVTGVSGLAWTHQRACL
jgi:hypothetical protein